jgi:Glycosyl hydrolase family 20, catalytic domain
MIINMLLPKPEIFNVYNFYTKKQNMGNFFLFYAILSVSIFFFVNIAGAAPPQLELKENKNSVKTRMLLFTVYSRPPNIRRGTLEDMLRMKRKMLNKFKAIIRQAAAYKFTHITFIFGGSVELKSHPEACISIEDYKRDKNFLSISYTQKEIKELLKECKAHNIKAVPELKSWGHANWGKWIVPGNNLVLYKDPSQKNLFAPGGKDFNLQNPKIYPYLFDIYDELIALFDNPEYFHIGFDEARDYGKQSGEDLTLIASHVNKLNNYFRGKGIKVLMNGDMFRDRDNAEFKAAGLCELNSKAPVYSHRVLPKLPKDIIICNWHYNPAVTQFPSVDFFQKNKFRVFNVSWASERNINNIISYGAQRKCAGYILGLFNFALLPEKQVMRIIGLAGLKALHPQASVSSILDAYPELKRDEYMQSIGKGKVITLQKGQLYSTHFYDLSDFDVIRANKHAFFRYTQYSSVLTSKHKNKTAIAEWHIKMIDPKSRLVVSGRDAGATKRCTRIFYKTSESSNWRELTSWKKRAKHIRDLGKSYITTAGNDGDIYIQARVSGPRGGLDIIRFQTE